VTYDPGIVTDALDRLRSLKLIRVVHPSSGRAVKYRHVLDEALGLDRSELAVLTVLMLRGPQTLGELRTRTERMHAFATTGDVDTVLDALAARNPSLVARLERQAGQKEARSAHLLCGAPMMPEHPAAGFSSAPARASATTERIELLENRVAALEEALDELRRQLGA
jgi:uncharacterized protein YceH (UPF0502 family)